MKHLLPLFVLPLCIFFANVCRGETITLPQPSFKLSGNTGLFETLGKRQSNRTFSDVPLSNMQLSELLWCAYGSNRPNGKRTIAAALGKYTISIYVLTKDGIFRHDRAGNTLSKVSAKDMRKFAEGRGTMGPAAGAVFLLVADNDVFKSMPAEKANLLIGYEAGSICQDIYLYCAAAGLNTVCCGSLDAKALAAELKLPASQSPILTMIVGKAPGK